MKIKLLGSTIGLYHCSLSPGFGKENVPSRQCFAFFGAHDELGQWILQWTKRILVSYPVVKYTQKPVHSPGLLLKKQTFLKNCGFFVFICVHVCPVIETNSEQAFIFVSFRLLPSVSHVTSPGYEKASLPGRYGGRDGCFAVKKTLLCTFPRS